MVSMAVVIIVGCVEGRASEDGAHTSSTGGEGDKGAVQRSRSKLGGKRGHCDGVCRMEMNNG